MGRFILLLVCLMAVVGCRTTARKARIDDVAVPYPQNSGYRIVGVDGAPESRAAGKVATYVPVVLVDPGAHTFLVAAEGEYEPKAIIGTVEAGKEYRISKKDDGTPVLVENIR